MNSITLKELPAKVEYRSEIYEFVTHLDEVAENAAAAGEKVLRVSVPNRRRKGMEYLPQYNRAFVKYYYYICELKQNIRKYYN